ncbi:MAG TPA: metallophosphoesterase family protein [Terriglobales bacterium]|nr:metallophosphoesterase family protein [Terriglobales bacterium]
MATIAIGDIHGNLSALSDLLDKVLPDIQPGDVIVFLGDYIDRGPETRGCLETIIELKQAAKYSVIALLGNHEQWMLQSLDNPTKHSWLICTDALTTIASYSEEAAIRLRREFENAGRRLLDRDMPLPYHVFFESLPPSHLEFLKDLKPYYRTPEVICVHGGVDVGGEPPETSDRNLLVWGMTGWPDQYVGQDQVVYGHWDNADLSDQGWPSPHVLSNGTFGIDTISRGVLTALRFPDLKLYQSGRF